MEENGKRTRRAYTEEFKREAIALGSKVGPSKAARELGINESQIRHWKKRVYQTTENVKSYEDLEKENKRLQKELEYLKEINRVLKKSTAIFSQDLIGNSK